MDGWHVLSIMKRSSRKWDWVALMIDIDPEVLRYTRRQAEEKWVPIPGKHRTRAEATAACKAMLATKH